MAKITWTFTDESGDNLNRYIATNVTTGEKITFDLLRGGTIKVAGTPLNKATLDKLITAINEAYDEIKTNETNISTNKTAISTNATNISTNKTNIATNTSDISTLKTSVSTNTTDISTLKKSVSTNTSDISTLKTSVSTNTSNISSNTTNISNLTKTVGTNTTNIATNTSNISSNTTNIATNTTDISNIKNGTTVVEKAKNDDEGSSLKKYRHVLSINTSDSTFSSAVNYETGQIFFTILNSSENAMTTVSSILTNQKDKECFPAFFSGMYGYGSGCVMRDGASLYFSIRRTKDTSSSGNAVKDIYFTASSSTKFTDTVTKL